MKPNIIQPRKFSRVYWFDELVEVNYGVRPSFDEMNGKWFDWVNQRINTIQPVLRPIRADVPTSGIERVRMGYLKFGHNFTNEQGLDACTQSRVRPVTDLELVYFGKEFPTEQRHNPIIELGSFFPFNGYPLSACLLGSDRGRHLRLFEGSIRDPWRGNYRILVRE